MFRPATAAVVLALATVNAASAQEAAATDSCRFTQRPSVAGDRIDQAVDVQLDLLVSITQGNQVVKRENAEIGRRQQRTTELLKVDAPRETTARITFQSATQTASGEDGEPRAKEQAVSGRTYVVSRRQDRLEIRTADGEEPSPEERQLVATAAESLGRKAPLATFLNGRTVTVGETLQLPDEAARELFAGWQANGALHGVELTLRELSELDGMECAAFDARMLMDSASLGTSLRVTGSLVVEVDTCRTRKLEMVGPVSVTEDRGPAGAQFTFRQDGTARVAMQAKHLPR